MTLTLSKKMAEFTSRLETPQNNYQQAAAERLENMDFPSTRDEYWKYTRLGKITNTAFELGTKLTKTDISSFQTCDNIITIAQGEIRDDLSSFNDLSIVVERSFPGQFGVNNVRNEEKATIFTTINDAYFREEVVITIPKNTLLSAPLHVLVGMRPRHEGQEREQGKHTWCERTVEVWCAEVDHQLCTQKQASPPKPRGPCPMLSCGPPTGQHHKERGC